jgi:hypothetical protein
VRRVRCTQRIYAHNVYMHTTYICTQRIYAHNVCMHTTYVCTQRMYAHNVYMHTTYRKQCNTRGRQWSPPPTADLQAVPSGTRTPKNLVTRTGGAGEQVQRVKDTQVSTIRVELDSAIYCPWSPLAMSNESTESINSPLTMSNESTESINSPLTMSPSLLSLLIAHSPVL